MSLLRTSQAAAQVGVAKSTLWKMATSEPKLAACQIRRGWWDRQRLIEAGYIEPNTPRQATAELDNLRERVIALENKIARIAQAVIA